MSSIPNKNNLTATGLKKTQFRTSINLLLDYLSGLLGTDGTTATALATLGAASSNHIHSALAFLQSKGNNVSISNGILDFTTATGQYLLVTGNTSDVINSIILNTGNKIFVIFNGTFILTNNSNLILPSSSNITTSLGDFALFIGDTPSIVRCVFYDKFSGTPLKSLEFDFNVPHTFTAAQTFSGGLVVSSEIIETIVIADTSTAYTINLSNGILFKLTLTSNCTFTFPTPTAGKQFTLILTQDSIGNKTITWPSSVKWPSNLAPIITLTSYKTDIYSFLADGINWMGFTSGQKYSIIPQTISFTSIPSSISISSTGTVVATASSGLTVTYSSTTPSICTISGSTVTGVAEGTCEILARQIGNADYIAAPDVSRNCSIIKASQTISFTSIPSSIRISYTGTVVATASSGLTVTYSSTTPSICTISGSTVTGVAEGTCIIQANQAGNATYLPATNTTNIPIAVVPVGSLWAWGSNRYGQLGDNSTANKSSPVAVAGGGSWIAVSSGYYNSLGIKSDDTLWVWESSPTAVSGGGSWIAVSNGRYHSLGIKLDGTLWAWGYNVYGQLGDNSTTDKSSPVAVAGGGSWIAVSSGRLQSLGIKSDGTLWAWGRNNFGQLGDNSTTDTSSPVAISGGGSWIAVSSGRYQSLGIKSDGTLFGWGLNDFGQLGDGTTTGKSSPVAVAGGGSWIAVSGGYYHSLGIKSDGTLFGWGCNNNGQLGSNSTASVLSPVAVAGGGSWIAVSGGGGHSLGIKSDGTLWAWGYNDYGQLGNNSTANKLSPVAVAGGGSWIAVSSGFIHSAGIKSA